MSLNRLTAVRSSNTNCYFSICERYSFNYLPFPGGQPGKMEWNNRSPGVAKRTGGVNWAPIAPGTSATAAAPQPSATWGAGGAPAPMVGRGPSPSFATPAFGAGNPMMPGNPMMSGAGNMGQSSNFNPFDNNPQTMHPTSLGPFGAHATPTFPNQSPIISPAYPGPFGAPTAAQSHNWGL